MLNPSRPNALRRFRYFVVLLVGIMALTAGCEKKQILSPAGGTAYRQLPQSTGEAAGAPVSTGQGQPAVVTIYDNPTVVSGDPGTKPYTVQGKTYQPMLGVDGYSEEGIASWYGPDFHGKLTASGERYDMHGQTAAHKVLPFGTVVRVTNLENGKSTDVRINDRGPFVESRIIDLSRASAAELDILQKGTAMVRIETLNKVSGLNNGELQGHFYVQLGSFGKEENAANLVTTLGRAGDKGRRVYSVNVNMWRVQIGPYATLGAAEDAAEKHRRDFPDCYIIAD